MQQSLGNARPDPQQMKQAASDAARQKFDDVHSGVLASKDNLRQSLDNARPDSQIAHSFCEHRDRYKNHLAAISQLAAVSNPSLDGSAFSPPKPSDLFAQGKARLQDQVDTLKSSMNTVTTEAKTNAEQQAEAAPFTAEQRQQYMEALQQNAAQYNADNFKNQAVDYAQQNNALATANQHLADARSAFCNMVNLTMPYSLATQHAATISALSLPLNNVGTASMPSVQDQLGPALNTLQNQCLPPAMALQQQSYSAKDAATALFSGIQNNQSATSLQTHISTIQGAAQNMQTSVAGAANFDPSQYYPSMPAFPATPTPQFNQTATTVGQLNGLLTKVQTLQQLQPTLPKGFLTDTCGNLQNLMGTLGTNLSNLHDQIKSQLPFPNLDELGGLTNKVTNEFNALRFSTPHLWDLNNSDFSTAALTSALNDWQTKMSAPLQKMQSLAGSVHDKLKGNLPNLSNVNPFGLEGLLPKQLTGVWSHIDNHLSALLNKKPNVDLPNLQLPKLDPAQVKASLGDGYANLCNAKDSLDKAFSASKEAALNVKNHLPKLPNLPSMLDISMGLDNALTSLNAYQPTTPACSTNLADMKDSLSTHIQQTKALLQGNNAIDFSAQMGAIISPMLEIQAALAAVNAAEALPEIADINEKFTAIKVYMPKMPKVQAEAGGGTPLATDGAQLQCLFAVAVMPLTALPLVGNCKQRPVAFVTDMMPFANVKPFTGCMSAQHPLASTGAPAPWPCLPAIEGMWESGAKKVTNKMGMAAAVQGCRVSCALGGGSITIVNTDQIQCKAK